MQEINIHNCNCLSLLKGFSDNEFQISIVDPPYGIGDEKLTSGGTWASKYKKGDAAWDIAPEQEYFNELFRVSKDQVIWGGNYFNLPITRGFIVWDKIAHIPTMADCEYAWTSFDRNAKIIKCLRAGNQTQEERIHISQKPVKLYKWVISNYAQKGDKILDTHGGSMSIVCAAIDLGFDITICEIDKDKFELAKHRILNHASQLNAFQELPKINFY